MCSRRIASCHRKTKRGSKQRCSSSSSRHGPMRAHPTYPRETMTRSDQSGETARPEHATHAPASFGEGEAPRAEPRNLVLRALPPDEYAQLLPHLEPCALKALELIADAEHPLQHAYFPETGIVSV